MATLEKETYEAVREMLNSLEPVAKTAGSAGTEVRAGADTFNKLLANAKECYPQSKTIKEMLPLGGGDNIAALIGKLGALFGAMNAQRTS